MAPIVTFIDPDGTVHSGEAAVGESLMSAALTLNVTGIFAECGGMLACSTCHCYVEPQWMDRLEPVSDLEDGMLEAAADPEWNSRLSCQITVTSDLDGLVVRVPARQA